MCRHGFILCGTESTKNNPIRYKTYAIVEFVSIPTYEKCYAGAILSLAISLKYYLQYNIPLANPQHNTTTHNNQNGTLPLYPPATFPPLSVSMAAAPKTDGDATPYGPMQGACHQVR